MCDTKDAKRYEQLAKLQEQQGENEKAHKNYLEAASVYVLEAEVRKNDELIKDANRCYKRSKEVLGKKFNDTLTKQELAKRTIIELDDIEKGTKPKETKMCGKNSILTQIELAKKQEKKNPKEAAKNYFEAADKLLKESYNDPSREKEYIALANEIYIKAKQLKGIKTSKKDFSQGDVLSKSKNKISFNDIGGLEELKEEIRFKIIKPFKTPELFKYYGKSVGGGILMYGPPGCGKSLIAKATANEADATFIHVKSSDLRSKFVGETEKNIAELFEKARAAQPTIIFFDEFEALGGDRTEGHSHERSAVAQLLTEMDGVGSGGQQILLLAATNEPWSIDPALRREGRFGKTLYIPTPDEEARKQIFMISLKNRPIENIDYDELSKLSDGFSGADIKAACETATDIPLKEALKKRSNKGRNITLSDMKKGIDNTQSVLAQWYKKARQQVMNRKLEESFNELIRATEGLEECYVV
ncbi:AAA family ATPase [candidate division KSB1 bacterium]